MPAPGPAALGRGLVIRVGEAIPEPWADAPVVTVDEAALAAPAATVAALHGAWTDRSAVVVALAVDAVRFRLPESWEVEPWTLTPAFEPLLDRLHFLVWANSYDGLRRGAPIWWWARKAERSGASATPDGVADVVLPDGSPAWVDGGPRGPLGHESVDVALVHAESVDLGRLSVVPPPVAPMAKLAPDQLAAVTHGSGAARVIAPAGSGKTRVLSERLRHLIVDRGFERETVLAVAYNKKAQEELEQRCAEFHPRVRTLNALGYSLLADARGRPPRVLEEREVRRIVEALVPRHQRRANTDPLAPYLEALSLVRLGLRNPAVVEEERDDVPGLAEMFAPFREAMASEGAIDFDEQVYAAVELLLRDGEFRRRAQTGCRHLLVDEFQDLTPAHVLMLRLLAAPALDVFGVGDDDQVIYGHAGADPAFLVDFASLFPGAAHHPLEVNYRCPVVVVDAARHLLSYNDRRVAKEIAAGPGADPAPDALSIRLHEPTAGATAIVDVVTGWLAEPGVLSAEIAVLARVNSLLLAPHVALVEAGVLIDSVLRPEVLERTGLRAALAYLRIGADPDRIAGADVVEVYRRPSRGFPQWITKWLNGTFTLDGLRAIGKKLDDEKVGRKVSDLVDDLALVTRAVQSGTTRDAIAVVKDRIGLGGAMGLLDGSGAGEGGSSHLDDLEALEQVATLHADPTTFEGWLRGVFRREAAPGGVTLSTVHRVKGREWDRVALFGALAGIMPHRLALDEEEERRVLHVAITRGRHRVTILADAARPSPFLDELTGVAPRDRALSQPADLEETRVGGKRKADRPAPGDVPPEARQAEEALRAWRLDRARRDKVPAFIVLHDRHLEAVAVARPTSLRELRGVPGIGPTKLELYGDEILTVLEGLSS